MTVVSSIIVAFFPFTFSLAMFGPEKRDWDLRALWYKCAGRKEPVQSPSGVELAGAEDPVSPTGDSM